ncbi:PA0069 family radical SAM protein [Noviherbaspirillum malthae]|uniref:PA0069 family radical SAM protein n=1 Tax=Noviherbaspirillum malthae TaxID=1260987 RepID=UPI00188F790F
MGNAKDFLGAVKGRGACSNKHSRFEAWSRESEIEDVVDSGDEKEDAPKIDTVVFMKRAASIISSNKSPDIPFDTSINPYQGCEHGCIYCYARPTHAYLGHSPGLDFETKLYAKENAAELLERELSNKRYTPRVIVLGGNTDPYQPIERDLKITRSILEVLERYNHPVSITTKSGLVVRDVDVLQRMAQKQLAQVYVSVTSLNNDVSRTLEPRASAPSRRLSAIRRLADAGIPVGVLVAPVIPAITDVEMEAILESVTAAGATSAAYILLRLPLEVAGLFSEWLEAHYPLRAKHVQSLLSQMRDGKIYDSTFGSRMSGTGVFAELLSQRFKLACKKNGLNARQYSLRTDLFAIPKSDTAQMDLF